MNKKAAFCTIFSIILAASAIAFGRTKTNQVKADSPQTIEYVDLGPGVFNPNQDNTPEEIFRPNVYSLAYRSKALMLFPNKNAYKDIPFNTIVKDTDLVDTDLRMVRIYTSETNYQTLDYYVRETSYAAYNIYADASINVSFHTRAGALEATDIYKIVFYEGFVLPYPIDNHDVKYVVQETLTFFNGNYHMLPEGSNITYAFEWDKQKYTDIDDGEEEGDNTPTDGIIPISACARKDDDYRIHFRGAHISEDHFKPENIHLLDEDDGTTRLLIFFGDLDYNPELSNSGVNVNASKFDISESNPNSYIHMLYEKIIFTLPDGSTISLKEVSNPTEKGLPTYNQYGEKGSISFLIGNVNNPSVENYNAKSFNTITISRGTEFPCYRYTAGLVASEIRYRQVDDITLSFSPFRYTLWATHADYLFTAANIEITSLSARHVSANTSELKVDGTAIDIGLSECNYQGLENTQIIAINENLTRFVYVNGRALFFAYPNVELKGYANLLGKENVLSIIIPMEVSEIKEIIVRRGCSIPSAIASPTTMEIYGGYISYNVLSSTGYEYKNNEFNKLSKIYWTLWFDGANPVRVTNASTYDFDGAPEGETTNKKQFLYWVDEEGSQVSGYVRITAGLEYYGVYKYFYEVNIKNVEKETSITVEKYTRLTEVDEVKDLIKPKKNGYAFQGYVDEDGNHFNINNRIMRDITLTATWIQTGEVVEEQQKGCKGDIVSSSILLCSISLFGVGLFLTKKKKLEK